MVLELINDATNSLPNVLSITEAFNTMWNFSLNSTSEKTFKDFAHSEEREVDIRALHGLKFVHFIIFLVVDLVQEFLPVIIKVKEEFFMLNHLSLSVEKHGCCLTKVLA